MDSLANRIRLARSYLGKRVLCDGMPVDFSIELTSRCNLKCVMCPRDDDSVRGLGNMQLATFQRIIDEAAQYLEFAHLHLAGEPLMHPDFGAFIDYAAAKGVRTEISTNGTMLDEARGQALIDSKLTNLIISIDGTDAATYKKIRGADSFDKVVRNAEQFLRQKQAAGRGPYTIVQMICMNENASQNDEFARRWKALGADAVRLKRYFNFAGHVEDRGYDQPEQKPERQPCYLLWRQMAFYYDGTAVSCCHDFLHQSELGNIHTHTLAEIWNSPVMVAMRQKHIEGKQSEIPLCAGCNQPQVGLPQVLGTAALNGATAKRVLVTLERVTRRLGVRSPY